MLFAACYGKKGRPIGQPTLRIDEANTIHFFTLSLLHCSSYQLPQARLM